MTQEPARPGKKIVTYVLTNSSGDSRYEVATFQAHEEAEAIQRYHFEQDTAGGDHFLEKVTRKHVRG